MQIAIVTTLIVAAAVLFAVELWTIDIVTLAVLLVLIGTGILTPAEAFAGFASDIVVVLGSLFVVTGALQDTGAVSLATARLLRFSPRGESRLVAAWMTGVAALSSVMNNTTVTGLLVGPTTELAKRNGVSPSRLLMPLAFASMIGGTCTLIGTSTNVAVSGRLPEYGLAPLGFFELTPIGIVLVVVGVVWMALLGRRFLPHRAPAEDAATAATPYMSEIVLLPESPLVGKRLGEAGFAGLGVRVVRIVRGEDQLSARSGRRLFAGDVLLFVGGADALMEVKAKQGIEIHSEVKLGTAGKLGDQHHIVEGVVLADSRLVGATLSDAALHDEAGTVVLGLQRRGKAVHRPLADIVVHVGDVLLLQGDRDAVEATRSQYSLAFVGEGVSTARLRRGRAWIVAASFVLAIVATTIGIAPVSVCFLAAAVLTVMSRCVHPEQALEHVPWRLLILVGGMAAFGTAMTKTGADRAYADFVQTWLAPYGPVPVLGGFMVLTMLMSQTMSNAAAALVVLPVAVATAQRLELDPRPFAIAITIASSLAIATPFEPSSVIVFGPGRYRFRDFYLVGIPLCLVLLATALALVPLWWPLQP